MKREEPNDNERPWVNLSGEDTTMGEDIVRDWDRPTVNVGDSDEPGTTSDGNGGQAPANNKYYSRYYEMLLEAYKAGSLKEKYESERDELVNGMLNNMENWSPELRKIQKQKIKAIDQAYAEIKDPGRTYICAGCGTNIAPLLAKYPNMKICPVCNKNIERIKTEEEKEEEARARLIQQENAYAAEKLRLEEEIRSLKQTIANNEATSYADRVATDNLTQRLRESEEERQRLQRDLETWQKESYRQSPQDAWPNIWQEQGQQDTKGGNSQTYSKYWAYVNDEIQGPYEFEEIKALPSYSPTLLICPQTPVGEKTEEWREVSDCPEFSGYTANRNWYGDSISKSVQQKEAKSYQIGDRIQFGSYPFYEDGRKKAIEWIILDKDSEGNALVISKYCLDARRFDVNSNDWKRSEIRQWLNNEFYNATFNEEEKKAILEYREASCKVFLLSEEEAEKYFKNDNDRKAWPTPYAKGSGAYTVDSGASCWWWLRSPGYCLETCATDVYSDGGIYSYGDIVDSVDTAVRPALRINLNNL